MFGKKIKKIDVEKISAGEVNASSINGVTLNADIIAVNNELGHFEIAGKCGKTIEIDMDKYILIFIGGILTEIREK